MKSFSIALIGVTAGLASFGQGKIEWSERRLTVNDFKGVPPHRSTKPK